MILFEPVEHHLWPPDWWVWDFGEASDWAEPVDHFAALLELHRPTTLWRPTLALSMWLEREVGVPNFQVDVTAEKLYIHKHSNVIAFMLRWG